MLNAGTVVVNGTITADGLGSGTHLYGGGAGGRIPLYYNTWLADPAFVLSVSQGLGLILQGQPGTLALLAVGHRARNWRLARFRPACLPAGTRACTVRPYRCGAAAAATS